MQVKQLNGNDTFRPWGLLLCFMSLLAIVFSIFLRMETQALGNDLLARLGTSSQALADVVSNSQYYFMVLLLVAGLLIDIIGARITLMLALCAAMAGNYLFCTSVTADVTLGARVLIGCSHPFIFISVLTLGTQWLPKKYFTFFTSLIFAIFLMLPLLTVPLSLHILNRDQLETTLFFSNLLASLVVIILLLTPHMTFPIYAQQNFFGKILTTIKNSKIWIVALVSMLGWIPNTFLLNYGATYLVQNFNFNIGIAQETISVTFASFTLGAVVLGLIAGLLERKRFLLITAYVIAAITFSMGLYIPHISPIMISALLFITTFFTGSAIICYAKARDFSAIAATSMAFGLVAFITTLGNNLAVRFIGSLLTEYVEKNPHVSSINPWQIILTLVPLALLVGSALAGMLRKPASSSE